LLRTAACRRPDEERVEKLIHLLRDLLHQRERICTVARHRTLSALLKTLSALLNCTGLLISLPLGRRAAALACTSVQAFATLLCLLGFALACVALGLAI